MSWIMDDGGELERGDARPRQSEVLGRERPRPPASACKMPPGPAAPLPFGRRNGADRNRFQPAPRVGSTKFARERRASPLRREAPQRASDVPFPQPLERAVAQLPDALAGHAEHRADLLERV